MGEEEGSRVGQMTVDNGTEGGHLQGADKTEEQSRRQKLKEHVLEFGTTA
jgi:hypothetical protein